MAFVRNPKGALVSIPDKDLERALKRGYTSASEQEVADEKQRVAAGEHPGDAFVQGAITGAVDTALLPIRTIGNVAEAVVGPNPVSDTTSQLTGENARYGATELFKDSGPAASAPYMQGTPGVDPTTQHQREVGAIAQENPKANFAGELAGSVAGFGPVGGIAEGAAGKIASKAGKLATEAAIIGGSQGVDQAALEAHHRSSYLTGQQALVGGGLGTLLAGGMIWGGKKAGEFFTARRPKTVPDLELPTPAEPPFDPNATLRVPRVKDSELLAEWKARRPDLPEEGMGKYTPRKGGPDDTRTTFRLGGPAEQSVELPEEWRARSQLTEKAPSPGPADGLSKPITEPDPSLAGGSDLEQQLRASVAENDKAFPRRTRYARGARDVFEPEYESHDLPLGGKGAVEPEELRAALNGEALNSQRRAEKVAKLMEVIPEGASPDWIRNMTAQQRDAVCEYVGVPKASEHSWKALEDAVAEREGYVPNAGTWAKAGETLEDMAKQGAASPLPNAPTPEPYRPPNPAAIGDLPPVPEPAINAPQVPATPYQPPTGPQATDLVYDAPQAAPAPAKAQGAWQGLLRAAMHRKFGGAALGYGVGGPVGAAVGYVAEPAARYVGGKLYSLAKKGVSLSLDALDVAMRTGKKLPGEWAKALDSQTAKYGSHYFMGSEKTPEAAYDRRYKELQALKADNGALIRDRVANAVGGLAQTERGALQAAVETAHNGVDYLLATAPKIRPNLESLTPMSDAQKPSKSEIDEYSRVYDAVMHPTTVLRDIANGTVTSDQIQALRTVYPPWFEENILKPTSEKLRARDAAGMGILPAERRVFDTILGVHSGVDNDAFVQKYAGTFAQAISAQQSLPVPSGQNGKGGNGGGRALRRASTIAPRMSTQTSTFLGGKQ